MTDVITAITGSLNAEALWGAIGPVVPVIVGLLLFKLGYSVLANALNSASSPGKQTVKKK